MNQFERDAYQIAENTPRGTHYVHCPAPGVGALIGGYREAPPPRLCDCFVLGLAKDILFKQLES